MKQPEIVVRKINGLYYDSNYHMLTEDEAMEQCGNEDRLIIKPANETGGSRGIKFWDNEAGMPNLKSILGGGAVLLFKSLLFSTKF